MLSGTIIISTVIVNSRLPSIIAGYKVGVLAKPSIEHITFLVKKILLSIDGSDIRNGQLIVLISESLTISSKIHPSVISFTVIRNSIKSYPLIGNHCAVLIYIIEAVICLNNFICSHIAIGSKIEPIVSGLSPNISDRIALVIQVLPVTCGIVPACSECYSGSSNSK